MKKISRESVYTLLLGLLFFINAGAQQAVVKTNPMKVYMHYMPWFETPQSIGRWGWHWTMNNKNPDIIGANGQRQIASHYYPLIGPYASRDKDVIEYHLLLLKLSGVDGVLINWYGTAGSNGDIKDLLVSSDSIISHIDDFGMQFGVVMEDRFSRSIADVKANMAYLKDNYFKRSEYIRYGAGNDPLVCIFGPITFQQPANWTDIMPSAGEDIEFLTLWNESGDAGSNADGEFAWVYQDNSKNHITYLDDFYKYKAPQLKTVAGVAYPGFNDFYQEGGSGAGYFTIPSYFGSTLDAAFAKIEQYKAQLDMVQLLTFNDFGEGTMFEPTVETGFDYLKRLQIYTGVSYTEAELKLAHRLFLLRKEYATETAIQDELDIASMHLANLEISLASEILNSIRFNSTIGENTKETELVIYPNPYKDGGLNIDYNEGIQNTSQLSIVDIYGKTVYDNCMDKGVSGFSIDNLILTLGVYQISITSGHSLKTGKLIVIK